MVAVTITNPAPPRTPWWDRITAPWDRRILWTNLVCQIGIVVTGGLVRLTGSGLGCSTWPQCEPGEFTPVLHDAQTYHAFVEFGNRTLTGVLGIVALLTLWVTWRRRDRAPAYRWLGAVPLAGVVLQALIGGLTVLLHLHPAVVSVHFLVSMVLVIASTALLVRHREGDGAPRPLVSGPAAAATRLLIPIGAVMVVLGSITTGAGPHSGDEDVAQRLALDPVLAAKIHAGSVWAYGLVLVALLVLLWRTRPSAPGARRAAVVLLGVTLAQGVLGYVQYFTGLPIWLVAGHMLGASLLVAAQTAQVLSVRERAEHRRP